MSEFFLVELAGLVALYCAISILTVAALNLIQNPIKRAFAPVASESDGPEAIYTHETQETELLRIRIRRLQVFVVVVYTVIVGGLTIWISSVLPIGNPKNSVTFLQYARTLPIDADVRSWLVYLRYSGLGSQAMLFVMLFYPFIVVFAAARIQHASRRL